MLKKKIEIIVNMIKEQLSNADIISIVNVEEAMLNVVRFLLSSDANTVQALLSGCGYGNLASTVTAAVTASLQNGEAIREGSKPKKVKPIGSYLNFLKKLNDSGKKYETIYEAMNFDLIKENRNSKDYNSFVIVYFENEGLLSNINLIVPRPSTFHHQRLRRFMNAERAYYIAKKAFENNNPLTTAQLAAEMDTPETLLYKYYKDAPQIKNYLRKKIQLSSKSVEDGASIVS